MTFGDRLRATRESKGWSQQALSEKTGLAQQTIHCYETGARKPNIDQIAVFSKALECSTDYLILGIIPA